MSKKRENHRLLLHKTPTSHRHQDPSNVSQYKAPDSAPTLYYTPDKVLPLVASHAPLVRYGIPELNGIGVLHRVGGVTQLLLALVV